MAFERVVYRTLPDKSSGWVFPFHLSLEGMESVLLCRCDEDYDHLEKSIYLAAYKCNVLVVIGIVMSNHGHAVLLAQDGSQVVSMGELIKKRHSQYLSWKYHEKGILAASPVDIRNLDSDWYVRNALAYVVRNAVDTGSRIEDYRWSGYRAMFVGGRCPAGRKRVADMGRREQNALFRTHEDMRAVPWIVNAEGSVEPVSACDYQYLESAFANDQAFFLKSVGTVNMAEMRQKLSLNTRVRQTDTQMLAIINEIAGRWYNLSLSQLTPERKAKLLPYLYRSYRTSIPQLARCMQYPREVVSRLLSVP
jgi:hypothetical protein